MNGSTRTALNGGGVGFRIENLWAYLAIHSDGDEGIVGVATPAWGMVPAIAADKRRLDELRPQIDQMVRQTKKEIILVRFEQRVDVERIK